MFFSSHSQIFSSKRCLRLFLETNKKLFAAAVEIAQVVASGISTDSGEKGATVEEHCGSWLKELQQNKVRQCGRSSCMCVPFKVLWVPSIKEYFYSVFFFSDRTYIIYITTLRNDRETVRYLPQG